MIEELYRKYLTARSALGIPPPPGNPGWLKKCSPAQDTDTELEPQEKNKTIHCIAFCHEEVLLKLLFGMKLLKIGGLTVAPLLAFQMIVPTLLVAGNSPVALILAGGASTFLVLCGIVLVIREWRQPPK